MNLREKFYNLGKKEWILLFISFFLFFFAETPFFIGIPIYLNEIGLITLWGFILTINQISLIFMPIIIGKLSNKFGNVHVAKISLIVLSSFFFVLFFYEPFLFIIFLSFPFFLRCFNSSLTPYVSKLASNDNRSFVFAVRDIFLYIGAALGFLLSTIVSKEISSFIIISKIFAFVFLSASIVLFFIPREKTNKNLTSLIKFNFSFSIKGIKKKSNLIIFTIISAADFWTIVSLSFIPIFVVNAGLIPSEVFSSYMIAYFLIPFIAFMFSIISKEKNLRKWFIFDILFDLLPLGLIIFGSQNLWIVMISLILFQFKDFVKPISIAYFFSCFEESQANNAWTFLASLTSFVALPFPLLVSFLFGLIPISIYIVSVIFIPLLCIIIFLKLPKV